MKKLVHNQKGLSLVEVLVSLMLVAMISLSIYSLIIWSLRITASNKYRVAAMTLADEHIELIHNMPYDDIGTIGGVPNGLITEKQTFTNENGVFNISTFVQYVDDPFDGTAGGATPDILPTDYKYVRVIVSWHEQYGDKTLTMYTNIAPEGMETNVGGGTLSILVFDALGDPVEQANVHIVNNTVVPTIDVTPISDQNGLISLPGMPASIEGYEISVTKPGYSIDYTLPRSTSNPNPTKVNASVIEGSKTDISFAIDRLSDMNIMAIIANLPNNWQVNNDLTGENQLNSRLAIDQSGQVYLVWEDYRQSADSKIFAQKYDDEANALWPDQADPDDQVVGTANDTILPDILVDRIDNLYIAWGDNSVGNQEVYLVCLNNDDGSKKWTSEKKLNTIADSADQQSPRIAVADHSTSSAPTTAIAWQDDRNGNWDVFLQTLDENGNNLWIDKSKPNELRLAASTNGSNQYDPVITVDDNDDMYMAWTDNRNGNLDIYAQKVDLNRNTLWANEILVGGDPNNRNQYFSDIAAGPDGNIYIVWTEDLGDNTDIVMSKYDSDGNELVSNITINSNNNTDQYSPSLAINDSGYIYVVWTDERNGNADIYAQKLNLDLDILWSEDIRVNMGTDTSDQYNPDISIDPSTGLPYASWESDASGDVDIQASAFESYGTENPIPSVPLTVVGAKRIGENPIIHKFNNNYTTNSSGQVLLNDIEWDSYTIDLADWYSAYHIALFNPAQPTYLAPNTNQVIKLYLQP